ncbi:MAG: hypothetical protein OEZ45_15270, partial [Candidatus Aminicenantes bacterium]|nr:hypothetical protein [Candidatus Aminicenantes bacterium]
MRKKGIPRCLIIGLIAFIFFINAGIFAQSIDIKPLDDRLKTEVHRTMLEGEIPSATVALVHEDKIIWTDAFGYSNLWA